MEGRFWTLVFVIVAAAALAACAVAPAYNLWFPGSGEALSTIGSRIDHLFYVILVVIAVVFVGVHIALGFVLWRGAKQPGEAKAVYSHGNQTLEVVWTVIPGVILLALALYQMDVWASFRMREYYPEEMQTIAEVTARQFEWRIRYAAPDKTLEADPHPDDVYTVNDLRVPVNRPVAISLRTEDVQHAFFVPELRVKQDALPGKRIPVWFEVTKPGTYDLVCAELCGWGHYKMKGRLVALSEEDYAAWLKQAFEDQFDDGVGEEGEESD